MNTGSTILAQLLSFLHSEVFNRCEKRYPTQRTTHALSAYDHFVAMVFAQLTHRESLRDIETCLQAFSLYHCGIRGRVNRCNLAYANLHRPPLFFASLAMSLMRKAKRLYATQTNELDLSGELIAIDASIIDLSLAMFPWAQWQGTQAAVKLNIAYSVFSKIPDFCSITQANSHDINFLCKFQWEAGNFYVFDRGYQDFARFREIDQAKATFVTRLKRNIKFRVTHREKVDKNTGLRCDQHIVLKTKKTKIQYPDSLRRIRYFDKETKKSLVYVTNNIDLPAITISEIYRKRWEIELFFRWIKQHLSIRNFYSRDKNGVAVQLWTAICAYLLVSIAKKEYRIEEDIHTILQIVSVFPFSKVPINQLLTGFRSRTLQNDNSNQLLFNNF